MTQTLTMPVILSKVSQLGFSKKYIREIGLPSWWDDELNENPASVLEGAGHIAQRLHLDLKSLLLENETPKFKDIPPTKFKYHLQGIKDIPEKAHQLASRLAAVVARATPTEYRPIPDNAPEIRAEILAQYPRVTLESLLAYCWEHGIAVAYFNNYPDNSRKITGMIQWQDSKPVIILSGKSTIPARLAFNLGHELGHLALGHIQSGEGILVDDTIDPDSNDQEEMASTKIAVRLLVNKFDNYFGTCEFRNTKQFHKAIDKLLQQDSTIDPCAMGFNYSWHNHNDNHWGLSIKLAQSLGCGKGGDQIINNALCQQIDWSELTDDQADYLEKILGA
ncbi:ImmA/IrrE family metallo-endopeptidase [Thermosynechococcaceae cyanobacterium BACA0444]|uniref:ImmA/IrrE family metallo-endopeptidase n=1 Tax=Pseudocalidococcus azoricus BACA0444 TaxID=2918990 RepID=A0AAE4JVC0_9CYAN|nr:ImmA/IrrE family metallo-endopeptidase [Pseudocalidococcus azoricus]MDS3860190.1 ImmA/IrrE family metallo-endopeptidase [Pseudocalidococcus azoricus BACA0444]